MCVRLRARLRVRAGACTREAAHMSVYACVGVHACALESVCVRACVRACVRV